MILIVDDDYDIVLLMKLSLEKAGLSASYFTDPLMALDTFRQTPSNYDLVISDIRMPHLNGYEFVRQIKMIRRDVRVILMSAFELMDAPTLFQILI
jgi:CheY-like chemotaxis protein